MADVEMKADNKAAGAEEEKKEEEQKIEEPTDHYYGKQLPTKRGKTFNSISLIWSFNEC